MHELQEARESQGLGPDDPVFPALTRGGRGFTRGFLASASQAVSQMLRRRLQAMARTATGASRSRLDAELEN